MDNSTKPAAQAQSTNLTEPVALPDRLVQVYRGLKDPKPKATVTLAEALGRISGDHYRDWVTKLRDILHNRSRDDYKKTRKPLDGVTFCGTFHPKRSKGTLLLHSGIILIDADDLEPGVIQDTKAKVWSDPRVVYCFTSLSGQGLKLGLHAPPDATDEEYKHAWASVEAYLLDHYQITADPTGKNIDHLSFFSWDEDLYINWDAQPFPVPPYVPSQPRPRREARHPLADGDQRRTYAERAISNATGMIQSSVKGTRHYWRLRAARLLGGYVGGGMLDDAEAHEALEDVVRTNTDDFTNAMRTVRNGLDYGKESPILFEDLERDREAWRAAHVRPRGPRSNGAYTNGTHANGTHRSYQDAPATEPDEPWPRSDEERQRRDGPGNTPTFGEAQTPEEKFEKLLKDWPWHWWSAPEALEVLAQFFYDNPRWMRALSTVAMSPIKPSSEWYKRLTTTLEDVARKQGHQVTKDAGLDITSAKDITVEDVQWFWYPYMPLGHIAMCDGEPGVGKSLTTLALSAAASQGYTLPDQFGIPTMPTGDPANVLLVSSEDSLSATIKPRLMQCGADCDRIFFVTGWHNDSTPAGEQEAFTFEQLPLLETALQQYLPRLVIIDPVQAYLGGKVDINRANETRPLLAALARYAARYNCCIVLVRHPVKSGQGSALHRGLGSIDFVGAARSALFVTQHPVDPDKAMLCHYKSNLGPLGITQIFAKGASGFQWAKVTRLDAETLVGSKRGPDPHAFIEACLWLEQRLSGGLPWPANDILDEADQEGYSKKILAKCKKTLAVKSFQSGGVWMWRLPSISVKNSSSLSLDNRGYREY